MDQRPSNPHDALINDLQKLSIAGGPATGLHSSLSVDTAQQKPTSPILSHKTSLTSSLPNSPQLRRQTSSPALPGSPSTRPLSRTPSMVSLSRSEAALVAPSPPLPPLTHPDAETLVILNDSSYLHKYVRFDAAKQMGSIVERPERIRASTFGISAAVCKLEAKRLSVVKTDRKGSLGDPAVTRIHSDSYIPLLAKYCDESEQKHAAKQIELPPGWHVGDLYLSPGTREDLEGCIGAVYEGVDRLFGPKNAQTEANGHRSEPDKLTNVKRVFVSIRPPGHHCADNEPSGFCYLNNVHIAISRAALSYDLTHAVILDFDLHHGDGSQTIAWDVNEKHETEKKPKNVPHIGYYSLHDINSYPCEMGDSEKIRNASTCIEGAHHQNIWNVHLEEYSTPQEFWELYNENYTVILRKADKFLTKAKATFKPQFKGQKFKAGVFISAGFDASEYELSSMQRHAVHVLTEFYARFTSEAVRLADKHAEGRVLSVLEGGYSNKAIWTGVFAHLCGLAAPQRERIKKEESPPAPEIKSQSAGLRRGSLAQDMTGRAVRGVAVGPSKTPEPRVMGNEYDPAWFGSELLDELDKGMYTLPSVRKPRDTSSTYYSPTASSAAKAAAAPRLHRKSSTNLAGHRTPPPIPRTPSPPPPPPPLDWPTASAAVWRSLLPEAELAAIKAELAKTLSIPTDVTNTKTRTGKRHSAVGIPAVDLATVTSTRTLRERKKPTPEIPERGGSALSSVAETLPSRRASLNSIKSSDTLDTAITGVSQISSRRKVEPQKTTAPKLAATTKTSRALAAATSTGGVNAAKQPTARKSTGSVAASASGPVKAPVRTSSVRQSTGSRRTAIKTNMGPPGNIKKEGESVSPVNTATIPSIKTPIEPENGNLDTITSGIQSIKLTYRNRDRDEAEMEQQKLLEEQERKMEEEIAKIQEEKRLLLEKKHKKENTGSSTVIKSEQLVEQENSKVLRNGVPEVHVKQEEQARPSSKGKAAARPLPQFTATSVIPFAAPSQQNPIQAVPSKESSQSPSVAQLIQAANGGSFRDRIAAMTPPKPKDRGTWQVGDEITPARAYKPAPARVLPPHNAEGSAPEDPPRRVDEDLK
ncbi:hypothetical protein ABW19_dt0203860 [Dactylella cylindrospora]|nr:hypothetical protein ABW19_dt0203860 [Dactylella cylindrospora]